MTKAAYIIIDIQNDYFPGGAFTLTNIADASAKAAQFLKFVREHNNKSSPDDEIKIVHVRHEADETGTFFIKGTEGAEISDVVKPQGDETIIVKKHPNSFVGTQLGEILKKEGVDTLYVAGAMANICIQGTVRHASEIGYKVITLKDAIGTRAFEYDGRVVDAEDVKTAVFATLAFGYSELKNTDDVISTLK
jgi:nicotinamidase-related amidase